MAETLIGKLVKVTGNTADFGHHIIINSMVEVESEYPAIPDCYNVKGPCDSGSICTQVVHKQDFEILNTNKTMVNQLMKAALLVAANDLLKANNTVTTLEVKLKLRKDNPEFYWSQAVVSQMMDELAQNSTFIFSDNGTYRIYSNPATVRPTPKVKVATKATTNATNPRVKVTAKGKKLTRVQAEGMMKNNKGHFFTATYIKKDGTQRTINCQYLKNQSGVNPDQMLVKETSKLKAGVNPIRTINLDELVSLTIGGQVHKIK